MRHYLFSTLTTRPMWLG